MNKQKTLLILLVALFPYFLKCENGGFAYRNTTLHFAIALPAGWEQIDQEALSKLITEGKKQIDQSVQIYHDAAFQRIADSWFNYPYFWIQTKNIQNIKDKPSLNSLMNVLKKETAGLNYQSDFRIDKNLNCIIFKLDLNLGENKENRVGAFFPGKDSVIQLNFVTNNLDKDGSEINSIINSFRFSDGYGYPGPVSRFFSSIDAKKLGAAIAFALLWPIFKKKKKKPHVPKGYTDVSDRPDHQGVDDSR